MEVVAKRTIMVTTDLDGVQFRAPAPINTALQLVFRRFHIPEPDEPNGRYNPSGRLQKIWAAQAIKSHRNRAFTTEGLTILQGMREIAAKFEREAIFAALSGRESDKHDDTIRALSVPGYLELHLQFLLNQGTSGARWKGSQFLDLLEKGFSLVDLEDDVKAALTKEKALARFAGNPPGVIYLKRNITNRPWLLQHGRVSLPELVVPYNNQEQVLPDFERRLKDGLL